MWRLCLLCHPLTKYAYTLARIQAGVVEFCRHPRSLSYNILLELNLLPLRVGDLFVFVAVSISRLRFAT